MNNIVLVKWYDARFYSGTYSKREVSKLKMCLFSSVGSLIVQDAITTTIAAELSDEDQYRDITLIPTATVISIQELSLGKEIKPPFNKTLA